MLVVVDQQMAMLNLMIHQLNVMMLMMLLLLVVVLGACGKPDSDAEKVDGNKDQWSKIEKQGKVIVGIDDSFPPFGFRDKKDNIVRFDIDLAKAVFKKEGLKVEFQPIDWSMKESELKNGTIDAIWNGYTVTKEREKQVAFSNTYYKNEQILVTLKKDGINDYADMKGKALGAQNGASGVDVLESDPTILLDLVKDKKPVLFDNFMDTFMDLEAGRIQGIFIDRGVAEYYTSKKGNPDKYVLMPGKFGNEDFAVGMRKQDKTLQKKVNAGLKKTYQDGEAKEISEKWFGEDRLVEQK